MESLSHHLKATHTNVMLDMETSLIPETDPDLKTLDFILKNRKGNPRP